MSIEIERYDSCGWKEGVSVSVCMTNYKIRNKFLLIGDRCEYQSVDVSEWSYSVWQFDMFLWHIVITKFESIHRRQTFYAHFIDS